jgi:ribosome-associated translation inhibitor RaiA
MKIAMSGVGFKTSEPLRSFTRQRVLSSLGHLGGTLEIVAVQLASEGHGDDRRRHCRLLARPGGGESLVVEEASADVREAINGALERMARGLERSQRTDSRATAAG